MHTKCVQTEQPPATPKVTRGARQHKGRETTATPPLPPRIPPSLCFPVVFTTSHAARAVEPQLPPPSSSHNTSLSTASTVHLESEISPGLVLRLMRNTVPRYPRPDVSPSPMTSPSPPGRAKKGAYCSTKGGGPESERAGGDSFSCCLRYVT